MQVLSFDEEQGQDMANNCRRLRPIIFDREIDPRQEIIAPALRKRREGYGEPTRDYKQELRDTLKKSSYGKRPACLFCCDDPAEHRPPFRK
jgi:hypothetical protein